jgi:hypothetical protein
VDEPDAVEPDAVVEGAGPVDRAEPVEDTDRPRPGDPDDPLSVVTGEEGMAWNDLPEEMQDPGFEPEVAEVVDELEDEEPVVEEPPEPEVEEESPDLGSVPMSFRTGGRELRKSAIERAQTDPAMTSHFVTLVRASNDSEIRKSAFAALMVQWESGIGDTGMLADEAALGIRGRNTWIKWRGLEAWSRKGTSLQVPSEALSDASDVKVRWLAARALADVAERIGQEGEAGRILAGRAAVETHGRVLKELEKQSGRLGR